MKAAGNAGVAVALFLACVFAYQIRLGAVQTYGEVIHEFDPWFNYRATEVPPSLRLSLALK